MNKSFSEQELSNIRKALKGWEIKSLNPEVNPPGVFYRQFGGVLNDREQENITFKEIAKKGLGPQCYFANLEYRIEELIPSRVIQVEELHTPRYSRAVAKWLAGLHRQSFESLGFDKNVNQILNNFESKNLLKKAQEKLMTTEFNEEDQKIVDLTKEILNEEEFYSVKEMLPKGSKTIIFCHYDPNKNNIIKLENTEKLMLVDYENSGYNYRGFDLAGFIVMSRFDISHPEPPFLKIDPTKFGTNEEIRGFIQRYLLFFKHDLEKIDEEKALVDDEYLKEFIIKNDKLEDFEAEVDEIMKETFVGAMLSQMMGIAAVINMDITGLPYSKYLIAKGSYDFYMEFKEKS